VRLAAVGLGKRLRVHSTLGGSLRLGERALTIHLSENRGNPLFGNTRILPLELDLFRVMLLLCRLGRYWVHNHAI
jgi:hypothetical protein